MKNVRPTLALFLMFCGYGCSDDSGGSPSGSGSDVALPPADAAGTTDASNADADPGTDVEGEADAVDPGDVVDSDSRPEDVRSDVVSAPDGEGDAGGDASAADVDGGGESDSGGDDTGVEDDVGDLDAGGDADGGVVSECGDGVRGSGESCDGADLDGVTCASLGGSGGTVGCSDSCTIDSTGCEFDAPPNVTRVGYLGGAGDERLNTLHVLSDGSLLIGGQADSLDWLPAGTPTIEMEATGANSASEGNIAFLMHVSPDLTTIRQVVHFPEGSVRDVFRIRSNEVPGEPTGDIWISGSRDVSSSSEDGYYIARLNGNFVSSTPDGVEWIFNVTARPRRAGGGSGESHYKTWQPWDVGSDDRVVYGTGSEYDFDWAQIGALNGDGVEAVVENWPCHWTASGEQRHVAASSIGEPVLRSGIVLKAGRGGSLRSHSQADYDALLPDGNGRTDRRGRWPDDFFYSGPCTDNGRTCAGGPGETGYRVSDKPTQRLGGVVIDRLTNRMYFGYSTQSVLPGGNPDFEPAVVGMDADGRLLWWSRLYRQIGVSEPDQYIDGLAFDHSSNSVVVLARSHGNNTITFWNGNEIAARPEAQGFQNRFTGTSGNIHISWLGRFDASAGTLQAATWLAELSEGLSGGVSTFGDVFELLQGQPNPNAGWPDLNTTRCRSDVFIASDGRVGVVCTGRRTITTVQAHQRMPAPGAGVGTWNEFVRVYSADLSEVEYSTLLTGDWNTTDGTGGGNTWLRMAAIVDEGVYTLGWNQVDEVDGSPTGVPVPTAIAGPLRIAPTRQDGLIGFFRY